MPALDERLDTAIRELHHLLDNAAVPPAAAVVGRHHRRRYATGGLTLAAAATAVIGVGVVGTRDPRPTAPSAPATTGGPQTADSSLLFPVNLPTGQTPEVSVLPEDPRWAAGLVISPQGSLFRISIGFASGGITPSADQRWINGRTFTFEADNGLHGYSALDDCARLTVTQAASGATAWNADATNLLTAITLTERDATIELPDGWRSLGAGNYARLLQLSYQTEIGDTSHHVVLAQAIDAPIAALQGINVGPLTPTTFDGRPAWTLERETYRSLIWNDNGNAVMLTANDVTLDELVRLAEVDLQHDQTVAWNAELDIDPVDTIAPDADTPTIDCGPTRLEITD